MTICQDCQGIGQVQAGEVRQGDRRHGRLVMQWTACRPCCGTGHDLHWTADDLADANAIGNTEMATVIRTYMAGNPPAPRLEVAA